jgi:hypothetical protein
MKVQLHGSQLAQFTVRAFILPRKEEFSNDDVRNAARVSNERQGVMSTAKIASSTGPTG